METKVFKTKAWEIHDITSRKEAKSILAEFALEDYEKEDVLDLIVLAEYDAVYGGWGEDDEERLHPVQYLRYIGKEDVPPGECELLFATNACDDMLIYDTNGVIYYPFRELAAAYEDFASQFEEDPIDAVDEAVSHFCEY